MTALLNGNAAQMTSQMQHKNQVKVLSVHKSENHEHTYFKFSGIIVFLSSNQNQLITLFPWQPNKEQSPFNLAAETAIKNYYRSYGINFEHMMMYPR